MYHQRKKPALLRWTQAWRRHHKKANVEGTIKRKARRVVKVQRAIVGSTVEEVGFHHSIAASALLHERQQRGGIGGC